MTADMLKEIEVTMPDGSTSYLTIYTDPRTGKLFGIDSDFVEAQPGRKITSPFNPNLKLEL